MAVRSSRDDKIARTRTRIQRITKRRFVVGERLVRIDCEGWYARKNES